MSFIPPYIPKIIIAYFAMSWTRLPPKLVKKNTIIATIITIPTDLSFIRNLVN